MPWRPAATYRKTQIPQLHNIDVFFIFYSLFVSSPGTRVNIPLVVFFSGKPTRLAVFAHWRPLARLATVPYPLADGGAAAEASTAEQGPPPERLPTCPYQCQTNSGTFDKTVITLSDVIFW